MPQRNNDILEHPLWLLKISGQDPRMNRGRFLLGTGLYTITFIIFIAATLVNFLYLEGNLILFVGNCEAFAVLSQTYGKVLVVLYNKDIFVKLITESRTLTTNDCADPIIKRKLDSILAQTTNMQKLFTRVMAVATLLMVTTPYFTKQFPTGVWNIPEHDRLYLFVLVLQEIACPLYVMCTTSIDCLFLAFCIQLIVQYKILQNWLRELSVRGDHKTTYLYKLKWCIRRHTYLLWYSKFLADTYSPIMLMEYISISMVAFVELYLVFRNDSTMHFLRGATFLAARLGQLALYCVPADFVANEALVVHNAIGESDWCSKYIPTGRNTLAIMIMRAQRRIKFSAGGLVDLNCTTLTSVIQFAWSVCSLMRGLQTVQETS